MESSVKSFFIEVPRTGLSYGFDFNNEGCSYKNYALISKVSNEMAIKRGLKVGDKVISVNGVNVTGKDYISLRNNMRKSINNCVKLEILKDRSSLLQNTESFSRLQKRMERQANKKERLSIGTIREKLKQFQDHNMIIEKDILVQSKYKKYELLSESNKSTIDKINVGDQFDSGFPTFLEDNDKLEPIFSDINHTISQEPFSDDSLNAPCDVIEIPFIYDNSRVLKQKYSEHIKNFALNSLNHVFEHMSESYEPETTILGPLIPKIEISVFHSTPTISTCSITSQEISPPLKIQELGSSSLLEDLCSVWEDKFFAIQSHSDHISLTTTVSDNDKILFPAKLDKQQPVSENIPIKLKIIQFKEKLSSKNWKDFLLEKTESGIGFKRVSKSTRSDKINKFDIEMNEVKKFSIISPNKRQSSGVGHDFSTIEISNTKYELITLDNQIHLKFFFNSAFFQDIKSSKPSYDVFNNIIDALRENRQFKAADNRKRLSESNKNLVIPLSQSHGSFSSVCDSKTSIDEISSCDPQNLNSKSISLKIPPSKSSVENLSSNSPTEMNLSNSKSIFKQAFDKIKPEKKVKTYEVFTGTKAEFEEFKKQLEGGNLPVELDSVEENGTHFNKYIHEVPRLIKHPKIPMIIYLCTEIVEKIGLQTVGIYRISGNQRMIRTLCNTLNKSLDEIDTSLAEWNNVHAVTGTLKLFLRKLKQNLIPADLSHVLAYSCKAVDSEDPVSLSKTLMDIRYHLSSYKNSSRKKVPDDSSKDVEDDLDYRMQTLQYLLKHLAKVMLYGQFNSMDEHALSICFNPVVMESWQKNLVDIKEDNEIMIRALELILIHQDWLFNNLYPCDSRDCSSELMLNALNYCKTFIEKKYDISYRDNHEIVREIIPDDININKMVYKIVNQSSMEFVDSNNKLERRHSCHMSSHKSHIVKDKNEAMKENIFAYCNSVVTEALDLSASINFLKSMDPNPIKEENKKIKVTYISSTENLDEYCGNNDIEANVSIRRIVS